MRLSRKIIEKISGKPNIYASMVINITLMQTYNEKGQMVQKEMQKIYSLKTKKEKLRISCWSQACLKELRASRRGLLQVDRKEGPQGKTEPS